MPRRQKKIESMLANHQWVSASKDFSLAKLDIDDFEETKMVLIRHYRIEWTDETPIDELFAENGPIEHFPDICQEGDDITMSDHHVAMSRRIDRLDSNNKAVAS